MSPSSTRINALSAWFTIGCGGSKPRRYGPRTGYLAHHQPPQANERHEAEAPVPDGTQPTREAVELGRERACRVAADVPGTTS